MSLLRKASASTLRNFKPKSGHSEGGFFAQGAQEGKNGLLFGETPPPPGEKRKWESWEGPWYFMLGGAVVILGLGLPSRPDTSIMTWAKRQAQKELEEEA
ncbi:hypothetical protein ABBQ32_005610 [Trebouxia sp. C0010 RCD-2024]